MKQRIIVVGAGGHARVLVSLLRQLAEWELVGILDRERPVAGEDIGGVAVVGGFADLERLTIDGVRHVALAIGDNDERTAIYHRVKKLGLGLPVLCHPRASIEPEARVGEGTVVCVGAVICAGTSIAENCIINTAALVDHESRIGAHVHLAPGVRIAGRVSIGEGTMVGIGSSVKDKIRIGSRTVVGAGSVVVTDLPDGVVAHGCPARVSRMRTYP